MKALLATQDFLPDLSGGIAIYYFNLCREIGGGVSVLAPRLSDAREFDAAQTFAIHRRRMPIVQPSHMRSTRFSFTRWPRVGYVAASQWLAFYRHTLAIAEQEGTGVALLGHLYLAPLGPRLRRRAGLRYGVFLHSGELHRYMGLAPVRRTMISALDRADFLIVNSEFTRRQYLERGVRADQRFVKVNPGVDTKRFTPRAGNPRVLRERFGIGDRPLIVSVARLVEWKGHDTILASLSGIAAEVPDVAYLIVGDGPFRPNLERRVSELGLADRVIFTGHVAEAELPAYYCAADAMAVPSGEFTRGVPIEGFGIVYVEAGACGTPVVGGRAGGTDESIEDGVTGFRVDAGDPGAVGDAITRLLRDRELARAMGEAGRRRAVELYDWSNQAKRVKGLLSDLAEPSGVAHTVEAR